MTTIKGYKGFDRDLKCRDKQYALNTEFVEDQVKICEKGLHFCENPLDVLQYYPAGTSRFAEVEGSGVTDKEQERRGYKSVCESLKGGSRNNFTRIDKFRYKVYF